MIPEFKMWDGNNELVLDVTNLVYEKGELIYIRGVTENGQILGCNKELVPSRFKKIKLLKYTGLTDKQNNPIYKGDIFDDGGVVRYSTGKNEYTGMAVGFIIEYRNGESWTYLGEDNSHKQSIVIGNIYIMNNKKNNRRMGKNL
jgi:hypothetical protein